MSERSYRVLSAVGPDRPGLVAHVSAAVTAAGANVEDSRMALLGGAFGVMMLVSGAEATLERLAGELAAVENQTGLRIHFGETTPPAAPGQVERRLIVIETADREGIVHAVSSTIYDLGGNIVDLTSNVYPAPVSGSPLFRLELTVDLPAALEPERLETALDELARAENLECSVEAAD